MSRQIGTFPFSSNLEVKIAGSLDARTLVSNYNDLLNFTSENYIINGFTVSVYDSDESKRGLYICIDDTNLSSPNSWLKIGISVNTLNDTLSYGNTTSGYDIKLSNNDAILIESNGSKLAKGSNDNSTGGNFGLSLYCSLGYELNWQGGVLTNYSGNTIVPLSIASNIVMPMSNGIISAAPNSESNGKSSAFTIKGSDGINGANIGGGDLILQGGDSYTGEEQTAGDIILKGGVNNWDGPLNGGYARIFTGGLERITVDSNNGFIGFNNLNPTEIIDVIGNITLTGKATFLGGKMQIQSAADNGTGAAMINGANGQSLIMPSTNLKFYFGSDNENLDSTFAWIDGSNGAIYFDNGNITSNAYGELSAKKFIVTNGLSTQFLKADGSLDSNSYLQLSGGTLTGDVQQNLLPINGNSLINKNYVDNLVNGLNWKHSVKVSTTTNLPNYTVNNDFTILTGVSNGSLGTLDGINLLSGDDILVKNESSNKKTNNGIYTITQIGDSSHPFILTRRSDANNSTNLLAAAVYIREGLAESNRVYCVNISPIILGTTQITFSLTQGTGTYTNGTGILLTGNIFSIDNTKIPYYSSTPSNGLLKYLNGVWGIDTSIYLTTAINSLNGLTGINQNFVNDTNILISSSGTNHTIVWNGTLQDNRIASATNWNTAYSNRITSFTTNNNSGPATLISNALNIPNYTLAGLGGEPVITAGTILQYWGGDKTWRTLDTSVVSENGYLYFTNNRAINSTLTSYNNLQGNISSSDSILQAIEKLDARSLTNSSTGIYSFAGITATAGATTFSIGAVSGWIVNNYNSNSSTPTLTQINYPGGSGISPIFTGLSTYVLLDNSGTIVLQSTYPTSSQRRTNIFLGKVVHPNKTTIQNVNNATDYIQSPMSAIRDIWTPIKFINQGITIYANGNNLNINQTSGILWGNGLNFVSNSTSPNNVTINSQTALTFQYRLQNGNTYSNTNSIDPTNYDNSGVLTSIGGGSNSSTNQRIFLFPTGLIRIQYGQQVYSTLASAVAGVQTENFVTFQNAAEDGILIGVISLVKNANNLSNNSQAVFTPISKFGEVTGGTMGISTTSLQQAYNNSSIPQIITNSILGGFELQRGSSSDTDSVFSILNGAGTITLNINGNGTITNGIWNGTAINDSYISSANNWNNKQNAIITGTTAQYLRGDLSLANFPTIGTWGGINYPIWSSGTTPFVKMTGAGTFSLDINNYITLTSLSAGTGISYNNITGIITSTITQYTDILARLAISSTATGLTYTNSTGIISLTSGYTIPTSTQLASYLTANQTITLSGDISGTGTTSITTTLTTITQASSGSFVKITLDTKGRVIGNTAVTASDITSLLSSSYLSLIGGDLTGTGGNGYHGFIPQSTAPSSPSSGFRLYADSSDRFSWIGANGYIRIFDGVNNTSNRVYTLPDRNITFDNITTSTTTNGTGFLKGNGNVISFDNSAYLTSVGISNLTATGTPSSTTYLRGDNTWSSISGTISGLTTNRIPFASSSTALQDDSSLSWDNTNKRLSTSNLIISSITQQSASNSFSSLVIDSSGIIKTAPNTTGLQPVIDNTLTNPPSSPNSGDSYLIPSGATGAWSDKATQIASWNGSSWSYYTPNNNDQTTVLTGTNAGKTYVYNSSTTTWVQVTVTTSGWQLNGNTVGAIKSIGTLDPYDLPFITGAVERMRLNSNGLNITNTTNPPEIRLTTSDNYYSRLQRSTTNNTTYLKAKVSQIGAPGQGIQFSSNQYFSAADTGLPNGTNPSVSISVWFKFNNTSQTNTIVAYGTGGSSRLGIFAYNGTILNVYYGGGAAQIFGNTAVLAANVWYHIVFTSDHNTSTNTLYLNGSQLGVSNTVSWNVTLGGVLSNQNGYADNSYPNSVQNQLLVYSRALTPTEVSNIFARGAGTITNYPLSGLLRQYNFTTLNSPSAGQTPESVTGTYYGTVYNTPTLVTGIVPIATTIQEGIPIQYQDGVYSNELGTAYFGDANSGTWLRGLSIKSLIGSNIPFIVGTNSNVLISPANTSQSTLSNSSLTVIGGASIGSYTVAAPTNGLIVSGNVGIGTSSPLYPLHITQTTSVIGSSNSALYINPTWTNNSSGIMYGAVINAIPSGTPASGSRILSLQYNNSEVSYIDTLGNIRMGAVLSMNGATNITSTSGLSLSYNAWYSHTFNANGYNNIIVLNGSGGAGIVTNGGGNDNNSANLRLNSANGTELFKVFNGGNVSIGGNTASSLFQIYQPTTGIGTVSGTSGGTTLTGTGTQFTNTFKVGDTITVTGTGGATYTISAIASDTSMTVGTLSANYSGAGYTLTGGARFNVYGRGDVVFGSTSNMWYDARYGALNIGTSTQQSTYLLNVNGNTSTSTITIGNTSTANSNNFVGGATFGGSYTAYSGTTNLYANIINPTLTNSAIAYQNLYGLYINPTFAGNAAYYPNRYGLGVNGNTIISNGTFYATQNAVIGSATTSQNTLDIISNGAYDGLRLYSLNTGSGNVNPPSIGFYRTVNNPPASLNTQPRFCIKGSVYNNSDFDGFSMYSNTGGVLTVWILGDTNYGYSQFNILRTSQSSQVIQLVPLTFAGYGTFVIGLDASAASSPTDGTLRSGQKCDGSAANIQGSNLYIQAGAGTGNSTTKGNIIFQTPDVGSSGSVLQSYSTKITLMRSGNLLIGTTSDTGYRLNVVGTTLLSGQVSYGGSTPTIAAGSGAGSSPTVSIVGTNNGGVITVLTGTLPLSSNILVTVTYTGAFATGSQVILYPTNSNTAILSGVSMVYTTGTTTTFTISTGTTGLTAATTYTWAYVVTGY